MSRVIVLQHIDREGPGLFSKIAIEHQKDVIISRLDLGESIPNLVDTDLLLVMGGPMSVGDLKNPNYPWLKKEVEILKFALENKIRVIGVCLGAQLLAYAAGGTVEPLTVGYKKTKKLEVGWAPVNFHNENDPLNLFEDSKFDVLHWHGDRAILPPSAEIIASSQLCPEQLFCINNLAYGIQFHVEVEEDMALRWISEDNKFIHDALGDNASSILRKQQADFGKETLSNRLKFINKIFDLLS